MRVWLSGSLLKLGIWVRNPAWERQQDLEHPHYHVIVLPRKITDAEYQYVVDWVRSRRAGQFIESEEPPE